MFTKEQIWEGLPNGDDAAHTHLCAQLQQIFEEFQLRERSLYGTQQPILISILAQRIPQFPRFVQDTYARNPGGTMHALFELACTEKRESWKAHFANFDLPDHTPEPDSNTIIFNGFTNVFVVSQMEMNYGHVKNFNLNEFKPDHYYSPTGVTVVLETLDFDKFEYELRINLGYDRNRHDIAYVVTGSRPGEPSRRWVRVQTREQWIVAILQLKGVGEYTVRRIPKFPEIKFSISMHPLELPVRHELTE